MEDIDYVTWFLQSSVGPIMDDCPMSGGKVPSLACKTLRMIGLSQAGYIDKVLERFSMQNSKK